MFMLTIKSQFKITAFYSNWRATWPKNYFFAGESHDFWEMIYVLDGRLGISKNEKIYELEAGNAIFCAPMEFHSMWNCGEKDVSVIILSFSFDCELSSPLSDGVFKITETEEQIIDAVRNAYKKTLNSADRYSLQLTANRMEELLLLLLQTQEPEKKYHTSIGAANYNRIISFLHKNLSQNYSTEEIARQCSLSVSNLKKTFRKYAGTGVIQYYNEQRMILATSYIKDNMSFSEIAEKLNFSSQNYFTETFKRHMKMTPMQYKKTLEK